MESIYRDAYPDVFATFDDYDLIVLELALKDDDSEKEDAPNVETV